MQHGRSPMVAKTYPASNWAVEVENHVANQVRELLEAPFHFHVCCIEVTCL